MSNSLTLTTGREFEDQDVVDAYVHRADYPAAVYARLLALGTGRTRLLDLGCGPGKLARRLAPHFDEVLAVDPSTAMLTLGRRLDASANANIRWINNRAEDAPLDAGVDLVVAGASVHWMEAARVMPKLAAVLNPDGRMAIIDGDAPVKAAWIEAWRAVIIDWVGRLGDVWNGPDHRTRVAAHEAWFDVVGRETFTATVDQAVGDLIAGEHSRATWARARMGLLAHDFDAALRAVLAPYAVNGRVRFEVRSAMTWGRPRASAA